MFQWLKSIFRKPERFDTYTPKEKQIFAYFNGVKWVQGDPLAIFCRLKEVWGDLSVDIKVARSPMKGAENAHQKALDKTRNVFSIAPLKDGVDATDTLTDPQCVDLLDTFLTFVGVLKKNSSMTPISVSETSPTTQSLFVENQVIQNTVDSGSTANGSNIEKPNPSISEPVLQSEASPQD